MTYKLRWSAKCLRNICKNDANVLISGAKMFSGFTVWFNSDDRHPQRWTRWDPSDFKIFQTTKIVNQGSTKTRLKIQKMISKSQRFMRFLQVFTCFTPCFPTLPVLATRRPMDMFGDRDHLLGSTGTLVTRWLFQPLGWYITEEIQVISIDIYQHMVRKISGYYVQ